MRLVHRSHIPTSAPPLGRHFGPAQPLGGWNRACTHQREFRTQFLSHTHQGTALHASSTDSFHMVQSRVVEWLKYPGEVALPAVGLLTILAGAAYWKYRGAIQRRWKLLTQESWIFGAGVTMERSDDPKANDMTVFQNLRLLELNPEFKLKCQEDGWSVCSLGDYMSTLRPKQVPKNFSMDDLPKIVQREIEAGLAAGLLKALGPNLGRALLPVTAIGPIQSRAQSLAANIATQWFMSESGSLSEDKGGIPISLMTLLAASDLNARVNSGKPDPVDTGFSNMHLSAIEKMKSGEVVKGPSLCDFLKSGAFVMERDFDSTISRMEDLLNGHEASGQTQTDFELAKTDMDTEEEDAEGKDLSYDPDCRKLPDPVPVNPRLFPGLHLGFGQALSSHTKREILRMRLLSILLNRLGANYYRNVHDQEDEVFVVQMTEASKPIERPSELLEALIDSGHEIEVVPTTHLTTFGINLCVKEKDQSWTSVPLAVFLESGYEDRQGRPAPAMMPHSGLDMYIKGPLAGSRSDGTPSELHLQHFEGIQGFCGWNANDHPVVPFNVAVETGPRLRKREEICRAARVAGLYANVLNGLATKLELPFGGYGLTAVCNDSAALVQQCLYGESTIFPMTSVGRFMQRSRRYGQNMRDEMLQKHPELKVEIDDLLSITDAMKRIPSDLNAAPANARGAVQRMLKTLPQKDLPFELMKDTKQVLESILREEMTEENSRKMIRKPWTSSEKEAVLSQ